jgi:hypothetical protein
MANLGSIAGSVPAAFKGVTTPKSGSLYSNPNVATAVSSVAPAFSGASESGSLYTNPNVATGVVAMTVAFLAESQRGYFFLMQFAGIAAFVGAVARVIDFAMLSAVFDDGSKLEAKTQYAPALTATTSTLH